MSCTDIGVLRKSKKSAEGTGSLKITGGGTHSKLHSFKCLFRRLTKMAAWCQIVLAEGGREHKNAHIMRERAELLHTGKNPPEMTKKNKNKKRIPPKAAKV